MSDSPVVFGDYEQAKGFVPYVRSLSIFNWQHWIVGATSLGLLYVDRQKLERGVTYFEPKLLAWDEITEVRICSHFSKSGFAWGVVFAWIGWMAFVSVWVDGERATGRLAYVLPAAGIGGLIMMIGAMRNRIEASAQGRSLTWTSAPLSRRSTLPICEDLVAKCEANQVRFTSSV